jgi:adenine-specific DNA glycosylase
VPDTTSTTRNTTGITKAVIAILSSSYNTNIVHLNTNVKRINRRNITLGFFSCQHLPQISTTYNLRRSS